MENRCESCIWYEKCKETNDLIEDCEYFDSIEDEEDFWTEMSYYWIEKGD